MRRLLQVHSEAQGETIDGVWPNEALTTVAFLGRRRRVYGRIVALIGASSGDRVLDVGCSGGYLARLLAVAVGPTGSVTGVDPSVRAIAYAQRRAPANCRFVVGVAQHLDLADQSFDLVTSTLAVHHIPGPDRTAAFGEMRRVLRPGGRLLVADFDRAPAHPLSRHGMRHNSLEHLEYLLEAAGFHIDMAGDLPLLRYVVAVRADQ